MLHEARAHIDRTVETIVRTVDPDKIILFGSYARGTAGKDSDVDLLVVMPVAGTRREARVRIGVAIAGSDIPTDVFVATPDEVAQYGVSSDRSRTRRRTKGRRCMSAPGGRLGEPL